MSRGLATLLRIPATVALVGLALAFLVPWAMTRYRPYEARPGIRCMRTDVFATVNPPYPAGMCEPLSELYRLPLSELVVDAMFRSLALLIGAAVLGLVLGTLLGVAMALMRRRALVGGAMVVSLMVLAAIPAFFVAYFLQIAVILLGAGAGGALLPVFGFGYDERMVLPLLSISLPAIAYTAQLTGARLSEVLDADFVTLARAKGLRQGRILAVHVFPHGRAITFEGLSSGLRVSVAALPIIEYLFVWRGIGQLALEAVGVHDPAVLILSGLLLASVFAVLSAIADLSRPRALFAQS